MRSVRDFGLQGFEISNSGYLRMVISRNGRSFDTCPFKCAARISSTNPTFGNLNSQTPATFDWSSSGVEDLLTRTLPNQRSCSRFGTLASSTRSTVLRFPPRSTTEIFSRSSDLFPSTFFWSSRSGVVCPPSHRRLTSLRISGLRKSRMSNSCLPVAFIRSC
jgi:hypothetical protein